MSADNQPSVQEFLKAAEAQRRTMLKRMDKDTRGRWMLTLAFECGRARLEVDQLNDQLRSHRETIAEYADRVDALTKALSNANAKYDALAEIHNLQEKMLPHQLKLVRLGVNVEVVEL